MYIIQEHRFPFVGILDQLHAAWITVAYLFRSTLSKSSLNQYILSLLGSLYL
jgi:hypothetical protein